MKKKTEFSIVPILFLIALYPLITNLVMADTGLAEYAWFSNETTKSDFFLYTKSRVLAWCAGIMLLLLLDKILIKAEKVRLDRGFLLLAGYGLLTVLSTVFSKNKEFSLEGGYGQYESVWVLLSYLVVAVYTYCVFDLKKHERMFKYALYFVTTLLNVAGISQWMGKDLLSSSFVKNLIVHGENRQYLDRIEFNFGSVEFNRVYMTLYNPNYVGMYLVMMVPLLLCCLYLAQKTAEKVWVLVLLVLSMLCLVGCGSRTAAAALVIEALALGILQMARSRKTRDRTITDKNTTDKNTRDKKTKDRSSTEKNIKDKNSGDKNIEIRNTGKGILLILGLAVAYFVALFLTGGMSRYTEMPRTEQSCYNLENITILEDNLQIVYKGSTYYFDENTFLTDEEGKVKEFGETAEGLYAFLDDKLEGLLFNVYTKEDITYSLLQANGINYRFVRNKETGRYQYITLFGKPDEIVEADAVLFQNHPGLLTHRGYIWARTIPLLPERFLLGSGPDTFAISFPQNDYVKRSNEGYGFLAEVLTKPHSWYLQMAVHSGGVAMLLCVIFFILLLKKSIGRMTDIWHIGIFLAVLGYLIGGLTNDSCVAVAPLFWILIGILSGMQRNPDKEAEYKAAIKRDPKKK